MTQTAPTGDTTRLSEHYTQRVNAAVGDEHPDRVIDLAEVYLVELDLLKHQVPPAA